MFKNGMFITGSEDGLISVWSPGEEELHEVTNEQVEKKSKKDRKPYQRPK